MDTERGEQLMDELWREQNNSALNEWQRYFLIKICSVDNRYDDLSPNEKGLLNSFKGWIDSKS